MRQKGLQTVYKCSKDPMLLCEVVKMRTGRNEAEDGKMGRRRPYGSQSATLFSALGETLDYFLASRNNIANVLSVPRNPGRPAINS